MKRLLIALILTFSGILGSFRFPFYGLCIYIWFAYMRVQEWAWGAPWFIAMRPSFVLAGAILLGAILNRENLFRKNKFSVLVIGLWILFLVSFINAVNYETAAFWFDYLTKLIILGLLMGGMVNTQERLIIVIVVLAVSLGFFGGKCGLFGIIHPGAKILQGPGGILADNNCLAVAFGMILPFLYFGGDLIGETKYKKYKYFFKILFFLTILGTIFTYSRGGFLTLCFVLLAINLRTKKNIASLIFLALALGSVALFFIPQEYKERISTIFSDDEERDASSIGRIHFWKTALIMAKEYPLTGVGIRCYSNVYNYYDSSGGQYGANREVHNSFLQLLSENGYLSLSIFLLLIFLTFKTTFTMRRLAKKRPELKWAIPCANIFEISVAAYCIGGFFVSLAYSDLIYHLFVLTGAFEQIVRSYPPVTQKLKTNQ